MAKIAIPIAAGISALSLVATVGIATALDTQDIELVIDGESKAMSVRQDTVGEVLELEGLEVSEHDIVLPGPDSEISDGMEITVNYARPLELTVDGETQELWTTATTVAEALAYLNLDDAGAKVSASRSTEITREGLELEVATPKEISLVMGEETTELSIGGTVADALAKAGYAADEDDRVEPAVGTELTDGLTINYTQVEVKEAERTVEIPFEKKTVESEDMEAGTSEITTEGVNGSKVEQVKQTYENGELVNTEVLSSKVTKEAVDQVTTAGPSAGLNLARAAMWDRIARCESTSNWSINTGNGYYGGLQFNLQTWLSVNGDDFAYYPHQASRAEQITVANRLYAKRGTQPWSCA